jgi:hypothetical protein
MNIDPRDAVRGRRGVRTPRYTFLVERRDGQRTVLFDNEKDPYQMRNIAGERPALVAELARELNGWLERTGDPWRPV